MGNTRRPLLSLASFPFIALTLLCSCGSHSSGARLQKHDALARTSPGLQIYWTLRTLNQTGYSSLVANIVNTGLDQALVRALYSAKGALRITLLAPNNAAFKALSSLPCAATLNVTEVLKDHVLTSYIPRKTLLAVAQGYTVNTLGADRVTKISPKTYPSVIVGIEAASAVQVSATVTATNVLVKQLVLVHGLNSVLAYCPP